LARLTREMFDSVHADLEAEEHKGEFVSIRKFFTDSYYLGGRVNHKRFEHQKTILSAFYQQTEDLSPTELEWLNDLKKRGKTNWEPGQDYDVLLLYSGQRWGKSFLLAGIAAYEVYKWIETPDPHVTFLKQRGREPIAKGAPIEVKLIATSQDNARDHEYSELKAFIETSPYFKRKFDIDKQSKSPKRWR